MPFSPVSQAIITDDCTQMFGAKNAYVAALAARDSAAADLAVKQAALDAAAVALGAAVDKLEQDAETYRP